MKLAYTRIVVYLACVAIFFPASVTAAEMTIAPTLWRELNDICSDDHEDVAGVENILKKIPKAQKKKFLNQQEEDDTTVLMAAAYHGHTNIVNFFLTNGADSEIQDENGDTALFDAAAEGQVPVMKLLVANGADPEKINNNGQTILMKAVENDRMNVGLYLVDELLVDPRVQDNAEKTAFSYAQVRKNKPMMKFIVWYEMKWVCAQDHEMITEAQSVLARAKTSVSKHELPSVVDLINYQPEEDKATLLIIAAYHGHLETVRMLLKNGADRSLKDSDGKTPAAVARARGFAKVASLIDSSVSDVKTPMSKLTQMLKTLTARLGALVAQLRGIVPARVR